jgi:hypothetical protein
MDLSYIKHETISLNSHAELTKNGFRSLLRAIQKYLGWVI